MKRHQLDGDVGNGGGIRGKASAQGIKIGQPAGIEIGLDECGEFCLAGAIVRKAADRLSLRCCKGARPSAHSAFCIPSASATKLSPPRTTWACSQPEKASRKW